MGGLNVGVWITVFLVALILINVFGVGKPGTPYDEYYGARLWYNPGAFANGFKGVCAVFVTAAFSFSGTELVGLAAAESTNPGKQLPGAIKQVFWRITLFYILSLLFVSLLVPYDEPRLIGGGGASASPFVIAAFNADLIGFDHFMNVAILAFGLLGYMNLAATGETVFNWLLSLSGLAALFTWGSICLAHIRFRKAWVYHGHTLDEIPFKAVGGVYGSWIGLLIIFLVLVAQFWTAIAPVGGNSEEGAAYDFFYAYLALPVVLAFWAAGYFWKKQGWLRTHQIDVDSGRREHDWERINAWKAELASMPAWKRLLHAIF